MFKQSFDVIHADRLHLAVIRAGIKTRRWNDISVGTILVIFAAVVIGFCIGIVAGEGTCEFAHQVAERGLLP